MLTLTLRLRLNWCDKRCGIQFEASLVGERITSTDYGAASSHWSRGVWWAPYIRTFAAFAIDAINRATRTVLALDPTPVTDPRRAEMLGAGSLAHVSRPNSKSALWNARRSTPTGSSRSPDLLLAMLLERHKHRGIRREEGCFIAKVLSEQHAYVNVAAQGIR